MSSEYLTCREIVELVTEYFDGGLSAADRSRFEEHVMSCPPCRGHLEQMQRTIEVLGRIPAETIPRSVEADLLAAFRDWKRV